MAVARSCLTLWVYRILVLMLVDPPITGPRRSSGDENQTLVGEGGRVFQLGLARVS
jgi:hypothetical protein